MPLQLSPMEESDIDDFGVIDEAAMAGWPFADAMTPRGSRRRDFVAEWTRKGWDKDPKAYWLKVGDSDTGELAAVAKWTLEPEEGKEQDPEAIATDGVVNNTNTEVVNAGTVGARLGDDLNAAFFAEMGRMWKGFCTEYIKGQPYANLQILVTDPKHQRKGAGSMLVKWGCDKADELGIISVLTASKAGLAVYTRHDFEIITQPEFDLRPFGIDDVETRNYMIRQPKSKAS